MKYDYLIVGSHREYRKHQRSQIRRPHIPHQQQGSLGIHQPVCGLQQVHQLAGCKLQGRAVQPALQHEHILSDVGGENP